MITGLNTLLRAHSETDNKSFRKTLQKGLGMISLREPYFSVPGPPEGSISEIEIFKQLPEFRAVIVFPAHPILRPSHELQARNLAAGLQQGYLLPAPHLFHPEPCRHSNWYPTFHLRYGTAHPRLVAPYN